jgi:hypothetical protein
MSLEKITIPPRGAWHCLLAAVTGLVAEELVHHALRLSQRDVGLWHLLASSTWPVVYLVVIYLPGLFVRSRLPQ